MIMRALTSTRVLLACAVLASSCLVVSSSEHVRPGSRHYACASLRVETPAATDDERRLLCDAAEKALAFFQTYDLGIDKVIRVRIEREPLNPRQPHLGSYTAATQTIRLLGLDQIRPHHALFGLPLDRDLYESVVVHELAHAIAAQHFTEKAPAIVFQEYLAYVAQLSTMAPDLRARILLSHDTAPFAAIEDISWTFYAMAPSAFGVKAYHHFSTVKDRRQLLDRLLSGDLRPPCWETE